MPFDRLIRWVDDWAVAEGRTDVVAQIGPSTYRPRQLEVVAFMAPPEFRKRVAEADAIIAHAGMGSIINALELGKPLVVVPRLSALGETRNDHQVGTARRLAEEGLVLEADRPELLAARIHEIESRTSVARISPHAQDSLLECLRSFAEA